MRSGATQQSPSASPKVTVSVNGDAYETEGGGDGRVVKVKASELIWGGQYIIELDNSDNALDSKDYEGEDLTLNFGFTDDAGSNLHTLFVDRQNFISREGELRLQLVCYDNWAKLSFFTASLGGSMWNHPQQSMDELDDVVLPSKEKLPQDLKDAINAQYDQTIENIIDTVLSDTLSKSTTGSGDSKYSSETPQVNAMDARNTIAQALSACMSYLRLDGSSFKIINMTSPSTAYSYNIANLFFENLNGEAVVVPNTIIFHGMTSAGALVQTSGSHGINAASVSKLGTIYEHHFMDWRNIGNLTTQAEVDDRADARITRLEIGLSIGTIIAPMHCSQELFDKVSITDDRYDTPKTTTGIVFGILREYDRGVYKITLTLGGVEGGYTPDGGEDYKAILRPDFPAIPGFWVLPRAIQGYHHDIHFVAADWNTVTWGSGTIKFYDGTTQSVSSGSTGNLGDDALRYIYFDLADASPAVLKVTTNYVSVMTMDTGLLCLVQRSSDTGIKANVIPSYGKEPLITPDFIDMTGMVSYDLGSGKYLQGILSTQIAAGRLYISSACTYASGYNPDEKAKVFRQSSAPSSGMQEGDLWIDTNDGNKPYSYSGSSWIAAYTIIDGGHITTGIIDCSVVTIRSAGSGQRIELTSAGVKVIGGKLTLQDSNGAHSGLIYVDTSGKLRLDAGGWGGGVLTNLLACTSLVCTGGIFPGHYSSAPSMGDGAIVYDNTDGHLKYYSAYDSQWFRIQRTGGWG